MSLIPTSLRLGMILLVAVTAVGCCENEKNQLAEMQKQNQEYLARNGELQQQLAQAQGDVNSLRDQMANKDAQLTALQNKTVPAPTSGSGRTAAGWERGLTGDRVTLGTDILFGSGSATLTSAGERELGKIAGDLKRDYAGQKIRIYGYTDNDPITKTKKLWMDNLDLSLNRSAAVARFLWGRGVGKDRIETIGMGDTNFAAPNTSKANKTKNRRVEIIVVRSK